MTWPTRDVRAAHESFNIAPAVCRAALGAPLLLAARRIHRPAAAPTIAVVAIITSVAAVAASPAVHAQHPTSTRLAELGPGHHAHPPYGARDLRLAELPPLERRREVGGVLRSHVAHAAACTAKSTA